MREFFISSTGAEMDWLIFIGMLLLICLFVGIFVVWFTVFRKSGKKRRKRRHHHRRHSSPTLAELGGLPPRREENDTDSPPPP
jgi:hypothetical protein